jgi:O-antigen ligase
MAIGGIVGSAFGEPADAGLHWAGVSTQRLAPTPLVPQDLAPAALMGAAVLTAGVIGVALAVEVPIGVGLLAGLIYGVIAVYRIDLGVVLFVPLVLFEGLPALNAGSKAAGLLVAVAWFGAVLRGRVDAVSVIRRHRRMLDGMALLLVWLSLSVIWADSPGKAAGDLWHWFAVALLFMVIATTVATRRTLELLLGAFVAGSALSVVVGFATGRMDTGDPAAQHTAETAGRLEGAVGDPNFLAAGIVIALVIAVGLMVVTRSPVIRWSLVVCIGVLAVGLAASESRGGMLAALVALVAGVVLLRQGRVYLIVLTLALVGAGTAWMTVHPDALKRVTTTDAGGSGRQDFWTVAWRETKDHPITGVGLQNYQVLAPNYTRQPGVLRRVRKVAEVGEQVHNTYLQVLVSGGVVGLSLFLLLIFACLRAMWRACRTFEARGDPNLEVLARSVLVGTIGLLAASFFISAEVDKRVWIALALGPALLAIASRTEPGEEAYPAS